MIETVVEPERLVSMSEFHNSLLVIVKAFWIYASIFSPSFSNLAKCFGNCCLI